MDFYVILGIGPQATLAEVKRAYRRLARKYHPDINPGDRAAETFFRRLVEAYETLSDPEQRRQYDARGTTPPQESAGLAFEGFDFSAAAEGPHASTFGDLFADVLRPADSRDVPTDGSDLHAAVSLSFDEAMGGVERQVTLMRLDACGACSGTGTLRANDARCPHCQGVGSMRWARGHMLFSKSCPYCGGTGRQQHRGCPACAGSGLVTRSETITVQIPAGVANGVRIRVAGKGNTGRQGGRIGDLYLTTEVEPHALFQREGDDLRVTLPVAIHEAALGAKIDVPTPDGPGRLRIPPGTQSGQRFRLRGRGVPSLRDGRRGDLIVEVRLVLPAVHDERSKELLREFGRIHGENVRKDLGV